MARSQQAARLRPAPAATPLMRAISGASIRANLDIAICIQVVISLSSMVTRSEFSAKSATSPPAQNAFSPLPVNTAARILLSLPQRFAMSRSSCIARKSSALNADSRFMVIQAIWSLTSNSSFSYFILAPGGMRCLPGYCTVTITWCLSVAVDTSVTNSFALWFFDTTLCGS